MAKRKHRKHRREKLPEQSPVKSSASPAESPPSPPLTLPRNANYALGAIFALCAYLSLINLDWATIWIDEGINTYLARNLAEFGAPLADDGRNFYTAYNGADIKPDGTIHYPPLMTALTAASFALFGAGEAQARMISALATLVAMAFFGLILRREFPNRAGFIVVAFAFACLAPMTLGYARSATYNATALMLHMVVFWAYLKFCAHKHPGYAILMTAAAIAGFYAHYFSNLLFMVALGGMHLIFRRHHFDRRCWIIALIAGAVYAAPAVKWLLVDAAVGYDRSLSISWAAFTYSIGGNLRMVNQNDMLVWSVAAWFLIWRAACFARDWRKWRAPKLPRDRRRGRINMTSPPPPAESPWRILRDDRLMHYLVFLLIGFIIIVLGVFIRIAPGDVRYFHSFTPFAALFAAAMVCWGWRLLKPAGVVLFAALLLSDVGGWPVLSNFDKRTTPYWTLPKLALEYHRDYPDLHRESIAYIRENVPKDTVVYTNYHNRGWLLWYLSDHLLLCCSFSDPSQTAPELHERDYLFLSNVHDGRVTPEYMYMWGQRVRPDAVVPLKKPGGRPQLLAEKLSLPGGREYRHVAAAPDMILGHFDIISRPEPAWRASRPDLVEARHGPYMRQSVWLYQLQR